ncbi:MAG: NfeD family protein [Chlamydiales bacterium]
MKRLIFFLLASTVIFSVENYQFDHSEDFVFKADLNRRLSHFIPYQNQNRIGFLKISSADLFSYVILRRALKKFQKKQVGFVLLEIDAKNRDFFSAMNMAHLLEEMDSKYDIPVIAFIYSKALGSAAILPYACRFIGTTPEGVLGAKDEKAVLLDQAAGRAIAEVAKRFGRNPLVAQAMVDPDLNLVLRNGEVLNIDPEKQQVSDIDLAPCEDLLTLSEKQMINLGIADFSVPIEENIEIVAFEEPYLARMPEKDLVRFKGSLAYFAALLMHPIFSAVLFFVCSFGMLITFTSLRFRFATFMALTSLLLILFLGFYAYAINWLEVALFIIGLVLLIIETVFLAGFGLTGIMGALLAFVGVLGIYLPQLNVIDFSDRAMIWIALFPVFVRFGFLMAGLVGAIYLTIRLCKKDPKANFVRKKMIERGAEAGFVKGLAKGELPPVGSRAIVYTSLRPIGKIRFGALIVDAICERHFIEAGQPVEVVGHQQNRAKVKEISLTEV